MVPPPATGVGPTGTPPRSARANLTTGAQTLGATAIQFSAGTATGDEVRAAASQLSSAIDVARATLGPAASAHLDNAQAALLRLPAASAAQPPDHAAVPTAANDSMAAVRNLAAICEAAKSRPPASS